jgi:hypothetical protein
MAGSSPAMTEGYWFDMCIACEMAFWMDMEEAERAAGLPKAQPSRANEGFTCDAPETAGDGAASISSSRTQDECQS